MQLDWSERSPHIRTLYAPWQPGDGYEENIISAEEVRLGIRLPHPLRVFYQAWGKRKDLTITNQCLLKPAEVVRRADALIFCVENQAVCYWAIPQKDLEKTDPPIVVADALREWDMEETSSPLVWKPSHTHVSDFLDTLTYHHAHCCGSLHGAWTEHFIRREPDYEWLGQHWQRITVGPMVFGLGDGAWDYYDALPFYIRDGQALMFWLGAYSVVTRSVEDIDEIGQALQVEWTNRW